MVDFVNSAIYISATKGTAPFTVAGAARGYQTPAAAGATDGLSYRYRAQNAALTEWEEGTAVASNGATQFTRTVLVSSAGMGATVNFTNPPTVALTIFAEDLVTIAATEGTALPLMDATLAAIGVATKWAREDHVHPTDTSRAPTANPVFTGIVNAGNSVLVGGPTVNVWGSSGRAVLYEDPSLWACVVHGFDGNEPNVIFNRSRATTPGDHAAVLSGDVLGSIYWGGDDGVSYDNISAQLAVFADANATPGNVSAKMVFSTSPNDGSASGSFSPVPRLSIDSAGVVAVLTDITSTSTTTGALTVAGGVGVQGSVNASVFSSSGGPTAVSPSLNTSSYSELLNTSQSFLAGSQIWFGTTAGDPYAMISSQLQSGPAPYFGRLVWSMRPTASDPRVNVLYLQAQGQLFSGTDIDTQTEVLGFYNYGAKNNKGAQCFIGYTNSAQGAPGGTGAIAAYFVGENDESSGAGSGAGAIYAEGRASNLQFMAGSEIDTQNCTGLSPRNTNPNNIFGSGAAPVNYAIWSQPDGTKTVVTPKDSSAWLGVTGAANGNKFLKGIVVASNAIRAVGGHTEFLALPSAHEITWYDATGANINRLSGDGSTISLTGALAVSGIVSGPTAAVDTNTTQLATTAYFFGQAGAANPLAAGTAAPGTSSRWSRQDHVHPTDTTRAALASPAFTGTPTAPTAAANTNTTQVATTAYADAIAALKANLASPTFTGTVTAAAIAATGAVKSSGGAIGYATGAGGTVTQATSKATGVTLSKFSGAVTMNAAALASGAIVSFVMTNTNIAAGDVLVLNHISGGTIGPYLLNAQCAAGSATINVRNTSAASLSEAIVIQFALVKAVNA